MSDIRITNDRRHDIRVAQAKRLWDLGVGRELGSADFAAYLAGVPEIPAGLIENDAAFPLLVLVEPRLGLKRLCELGGIFFRGDDDETFFVAYDKAHTESNHPIWIRIQDGRRNRNRPILDCRNSFSKGERGLTALQGVCAYLQHPTVLSDTTQDDAHVMDLAGSVRRDVRDFAACLKLCNGQPSLRWSWDVSAHPMIGSASRRDC